MPFASRSDVDRSTETPTTDSAYAAVPAGTGATTVIDPSIHIKGDVFADTDLLVEGTVAGDVTVNGHALTIGRDARVIGALNATSIVVHGEVRGSIRAQGRVEVAPTGVARGFIHGPRVVLTEGCTVWGTVNWEPAPVPRVRRMHATVRCAETSSTTSGSAVRRKLPAPPTSAGGRDNHLA